MRRALNLAWRGIYEGKKFPQWFLFIVLAYLTLSTYFALNMIPTAPLYNRWTYYILLFIPGSLILIAMIVFFGEPKEEKFCPDWDSNWQKEHVVVYGVGTALIVGINFLTQGLIRNYFPGPALPQSLMPLTFAFIPQGYSNLTVQGLWQLFGVAAGEETLKTASIVALTRAFKHKWGFVIAVILIWAYAHAVQAYGPEFAPIVAAVIAGLIMYAQWEATGNYQVMMATHASINTFYLLSSFGF